MAPARLETIKIAPYNQVLALTQHMINQGIDNWYTQLQTDEEADESQEPATIELDNETYFENVTFGPPSIIIDADFNNVRSVRLRVTLKSGEAHMSKYMGRGNKGVHEYETLKLKIEDWTVIVPVKLRFEKLNPGSRKYKNVQERSAAKGKPNHSIFELLADLQAMTGEDAKWDIGVWDPEDILTTRDGKEVTPPGCEEGAPRKLADMQKGWQSQIKATLTRLANTITRRNVPPMGFIIQPDTNKPATFETNSVRYMTYPFTDPNTRNCVPAGLSGDGRLNYLLYLETVGEKNPAAESDPCSILSTRMGNWTEGRNPAVDRPSTFGSFVLGADVFMEKFLLPKLSCINRVMSADIASVEARAWSKWLIIYYTISASWGIGQGEWTKDATEFALRRDTRLTMENIWQEDLKNHMRPMTESPGNGATIWAYKDVEYGSTAKHAKESSLGLDIECHGDTICYSRAYTLAGDNRIVFEGRIWTKLEYILNPPIGWKEWKRITAKVQWKVTFTLSEVSDGGMQIRMDTYAPTPEVNAEGEGSLFSGYRDRLFDGYQTAFKNFQFYLNGVRNSLQGQEKFTLPASGVFYFKDPMMDSSGNLVCGIEYNGNPKKAVNPDAADRVSQPQASYVSMPDMATYSKSGEVKAK